MVLVQLAMLAFIFGALAALLNYIGGSTLYLVIRLAIQGLIYDRSCFARHASRARHNDALPG
jgi:hypothetical protein